MKKTLMTATAVTMLTGIATVTADASDYTVKNGDTLWNIAKENGTSVAELKELNELKGDIIKVGDKIKVQSKDFYIVKKEDTLKSIAKEFKVKVADLKEWNNLSTDTLKEGKKLIVSQKGFDKVQAQKAKAKAPVAMTRVAAPVAAPTEETTTNEATASTEVAATEAPRQNTTATQLTTYEASEANTAAEQTTYETQSNDYAQNNSQPAASTTPVSGNVASVANGMAAGKSYVYGANSASAVDCSAFAQQVMASMGKSIPRTTYAQMAAGTQVSDPQPGDLVFFNGGSHVGVYVGNGQMVDALNPSEGIKQRAVSYVNGSVTGYYRY